MVDALKCYHQVPLDEKSAAMTTFSTPVGKYQYLRLPFGVVHADDDYYRRMADIFDDIPNTRRIVEDILVFSFSRMSTSKRYATCLPEPPNTTCP